MNTTAHIETLQRKRSQLKAAIHAKMKSPHYNENEVYQLKKRNLQLKDVLLSLYKEKEAA